MTKIILSALLFQIISCSTTNLSQHQIRERVVNSIQENYFSKNYQYQISQMSHVEKCLYDTTRLINSCFTDFDKEIFAYSIDTIQKIKQDVCTTEISKSLDTLHIKPCFIENNLNDKLFKSINSNNYNTIAIDLRNNNGGLFENIINFIELFTTKSTYLFTIKSKNQTLDKKTNSNIYLKQSIIVITDSTTQSGATIAALGLKTSNNLKNSYPINKDNLHLKTVIPITENLLLMMPSGYITTDPTP